jgi:lipid-A-disaccharide synthase
MLEAANRIYQKNKKSIFLIPVAPSIEIEEIKSRLGNSSVPVIIQKRQPEDVIDLMDFVIVASGTATLLVAFLQKPMIILYKMNPVTAWLLSHIVRGVKFFGLPNLISNKQIAPELFQAQVTPEQIEQLFLKWQQDLAYQNQVKQDLLSLREKLGANQSVITDVVKFLSKF